MQIPEFVKNIVEKLEEAGFEAYIVGGCVRDLLMGAKPKDPFAKASEPKDPFAKASEPKDPFAKASEPKDWDVTTNARPDDILKIFPDGKYENVFGTVIVPISLTTNNQQQTMEEKIVVEVTTYRSEQGYSDRRHPDAVIFEDELEKDLERRDFTINAMALRLRSPRPDFGELSRTELGTKAGQAQEVIDLFGGQKDIKKKIIRAVGEPVDRFKEDALRMMRAVRFAAQLGFTIEPKTERGIKKMAGSIKFIAHERARDELVKILESSRAYEGIIELHKLKLLQYILPELERGLDVEQNRHHIYTVFKHSVLSLKYCPSQNWRVRFAALLHDIAKPQTKKFISGDPSTGSGQVATFYNHDIVGAKIAGRIMERLKFSRADTEKVMTLIKNHMFYYNVGEVTASSVRRLIAKVGEENLPDLIDLRIADRLGSGVPKAKPYKLRHLEYMMKKVREDPVSVKMLAINGNDLMSLLNIEPGPKIGAILDVLLSEVIDDPALNDKEYLEKRSQELNELNLEDLRKKAKGKIEEKKMEDDQELKKEFWVK